MTDIKGKATLRLRIVGPLEGDESLPTGATAWISAGDDEPVVVSIPIGYSHEPATVEVSAGRVVVVLRCPSGRRGRREFVLGAGEVKSMAFGTAQAQKHIISSTNAIESPTLPGIDGMKPRAVPFDPNKIGQEHGPIVEHGGPPLIGHRGGFGGRGLGAGVVRWAKDQKMPDGEDQRVAWMRQISTVMVISQPHLSSSKLEQSIVRKNVISSDLYSYECSSKQLELGMVGCFAFVVKPVAPHDGKVLFHRTPWTHEITLFTVKPRHDATAIPIDTEVILQDEHVMPLLSFLSSGDIPSARAMGDQFSQVASGYLSRKFSNHHLAVVGAYALYALRETAMYEKWIRTLYEEFDDTSDAAILYAMHLMRARPGAISEWYNEARKALVEATARPIPFLTAGVRLLVEGLERLASSRRAAGDAKVAEALDRAHWIQTRARPDEIFTALWMDRSDLPEAFLPHDFQDTSEKR